MNKLKPCPYCGGEAELTEIGNDYTKKKQVKISCGKCRVTLTNGAIRFGMEWLKDISMKAWNTRAEGLSRGKIERAVCKATGWLKHEMRTEDYEFTDRIVDAIIAAKRGEK